MSSGRMAPSSYRRRRSPLPQAEWEGRIYQWDSPLKADTPVKVTVSPGRTVTAPFSRLDLQSQGRLSLVLFPKEP